MPQAPPTPQIGCKGPYFRRLKLSPRPPSAVCNKPWGNYLYHALHCFHLSGDDPGAENLLDTDLVGDKLANLHIANPLHPQGPSGLRSIMNPPGTPAWIHQHLEIGRGEVD